MVRERPIPFTTALVYLISNVFFYNFVKEEEKKFLLDNRLE